MLESKPTPDTSLHSGNAQGERATNAFPFGTEVVTPKNNPPTTLPKSPQTIGRDHTGDSLRQRHSAGDKSLPHLSRSFELRGTQSCKHSASAYTNQDKLQADRWMATKYRSLGATASYDFTQTSRSSCRMPLVETHSCRHRSIQRHLNGKPVVLASDLELFYNNSRYGNSLFSDTVDALPSPIHYDPNMELQFAPPMRDHDERPSYDSPPIIPYRRPVRRILEFTEVPMIILWTFASYWLVILIYSAKDTSRMMWLSALFSGIVVGVALNANAYKYIIKPKTRSRAEYSAAFLFDNPNECHEVDPNTDMVETGTLIHTNGISPPTDDDVLHERMYYGHIPTLENSMDSETLSPLHRQPTIVQEVEPDVNNSGDATQTDNEIDEDKKSHLMRLVFRFPRFFNDLVTTKRECVRQPPFEHKESNRDLADLEFGRNNDQQSQQHNTHRSISSGMNSLTKLAKDWSMFADTLEWELDIPTMIRFFIIPFAVSALSGMTSDEVKYVLVFPTDPAKLTVAIMVPAIWVTFLVICRLALLYYLDVQWHWKIILLNGCIIH